MIYVQLCDIILRCIMAIVSETNHKHHEIKREHTEERIM